MKFQVVAIALFLSIAGRPALAQEKLYPIRPGRDVSILLTADRTALVATRSFQSKMTLGFPDDDKTAFVPDTNAPLIILSLKIQNISDRPLEVNIAKFVSTDDMGKMYANIPPTEAADKILAGPGGSIGSKTLRGISLGRVGGKPPQEELREDIMRYSLKSSQLPPGGIREGLIYFDAPARKKFTVSITLGDLFSTPLVFSTEKQK